MSFFPIPVKSPVSDPDSRVGSLALDSQSHNGVAAQLDRGTLDSGKTKIDGTPDWEEDFTFDDIGNWSHYTTKAGGVEQLNQNRDHNVANETTEIAGSDAHVGYDGAGNMTETPKVSDWTNAFDLVWDAWNRLVEVKDDGTSKGAYAYDGLGRRVTKTIGVTVRHYYYSDQWQVLEETVGTSVDRQFVWGLRYPDDLVLRDSNKEGTLDERLYSLSDYFNISALVDDTGSVVERYGYDAYGNSRVMTPGFGSLLASDYDWKIRYKAVILDEESGFYQVRYRYLHPGLGRWLSRDPIGEQGGLNLYAFVENNPGNAWDWLGLFGGPISPEGLNVPIADFEDAGNALEKVGRRIDAGDRMGSELAKRAKPSRISRIGGFLKGIRKGPGKAFVGRTGPATDLLDAEAHSGFHVGALTKACTDCHIDAQCAGDDPEIECRDICDRARRASRRHVERSR